jgi:hypothetical protein
LTERNPRVFSTAPEETIRDHYLFQLNGQYEGSATGETARRADLALTDSSRVSMRFFPSQIAFTMHPHTLVTALRVPLNVADRKRNIRRAASMRIRTRSRLRSSGR